MAYLKFSIVRVIFSFSLLKGRDNLILSVLGKVKDTERWSIYLSYWRRGDFRVNGGVSVSL